MKVPIQNTLPGFSFRNTMAPSPTQTGAKFASKVDIAALVIKMETFQTAISKAKITPHKKAIPKDFRLITFRLRKNQIGRTPNKPINMR